MLFPESLYLLSQRDQQVTWLDPVRHRSDAVLASVNPIATFTVPEGRLLILTAVHSTTTPGAAQNQVSLTLLTALGSGNTLNVTLEADHVPLAANAQGDLSWTGEVVLTPGNQVRASGVFNAAAAANTVLLMLHGMLIPIGNVQRI